MHPTAPADQRYMAFLLHDWEHGSVDGILPQEYFAYVAKNKGVDPDAPPWHIAMKSAEVDDWIKAAEDELNELHTRGTWTEMHIKDLPPGANVLPGTWALKVKRYPDGRFRKFKARYCVRGDKQLEGIDYFQTYAPVVSGLTVRMLIILTVFASLSTVQVDYSNAFAQGTLLEEIYLKLPTGCIGKFGADTVLKLNRSLYGLKQAAICWFDKLKDVLLAQGWTQPIPTLEPCLFYKEGVICLVYVDDCLFFARDKSQISQYIKEIQDT